MFSLKISKSVEQGIYVVLMLALQKDHTPLKSQLLSQQLGVSDSYLKKILRKLVIAGLIDSSASKDGGFVLKRSVEEISLLDVGQAVEQLGTLQMPTRHLAAKLFPGRPSHIEHSEATAKAAFEKAATAFDQTLAAVPLSQLLEQNSYQNGVVDWASLAAVKD